MKRFLMKFSVLLLLFGAVNALLLFAIPADGNQYLQAYNRKLSLLEQTPSPRLVFIGGSNTAFGLDSRMLSSSLGCNVVNFGLHAGIGMRYPAEDALSYVRPGDVVAFQMEYEFFFTELCNKETLPKLMAATGWRGACSLTSAEWEALLSGLPMLSLSNLKRLLLYPLRGSLDTPSAPQGAFRYTADGFNEWGDEVSHWSCAGQPYHNVASGQVRPVSEDFSRWLNDLLLAYEQRGAQVLLLPPCCVESCLSPTDLSAIDGALRDMGRQYAVSPDSLAVPDSLAFDTGFHLSREGVQMVTERLAHALKPLLARLRQDS